MREKYPISVISNGVLIPTIWCEKRTLLTVKDGTTVPGLHVAARARGVTRHASRQGDKERIFESRKIRQTKCTQQIIEADRLMMMVAYLLKSMPFL